MSAVASEKEPFSLRFPKTKREPGAPEVAKRAPLEQSGTFSVYRYTISGVGYSIQSYAYTDFVHKVPISAPSDSLTSYILSGIAGKTANSQQRKLLEAGGGYLPQEQAARRLNCSVEAIQELYAAHKVIGILTTTGLVYPAWQFKNGELLAGFPRIMEILKDTDNWMRLSFMATKSKRLDGRSPLEALQDGDALLVEKIASTFGEQGAV